MTAKRLIKEEEHHLEVGILNNLIKKCDGIQKKYEIGNTITTHELKIIGPTLNRTSLLKL